MSGRYQASSEESAILIPLIKEYFSYEERSAQRLEVTTRVLPLLAKWEHWTKSKVHIWFANNQKKYLGPVDNHTTHKSASGHYRHPSITEPPVFPPASAWPEVALAVSFAEPPPTPLNGPPRSISQSDGPFEDIPPSFLGPDALSPYNFDECQDFDPVRDFPEVPKRVTVLKSEADSRARKLSLYRLLHCYSRYARGIRTFPDRLERQEELENRFTGVLSLFSVELQIELPYNLNEAIEQIQTGLSQELARQVSQTKRV
jgi:hypothetical protein